MGEGVEWVRSGSGKGLGFRGLGFRASPMAGCRVGRGSSELR